jgi:nucleoside-diphosphate-sugar epimerase
MYIVAGGLGGLGRSLISWMIDRGARHIVTLSRKSETKAETSWFHDLIRAKGVYIEQISCDITVGKELGGIIKNLEGQRPIRGIVHAAMALHVGPIALIVGVVTHKSAGQTVHQSLV